MRYLLRTAAVLSISAMLASPAVADQWRDGRNHRNWHGQHHHRGIGPGAAVGIGLGAAILGGALTQQYYYAQPYGYGYIQPACGWVWNGYAYQWTC
jgi:hypothetical protein